MTVESKTSVPTEILEALGLSNEAVSYIQEDRKRRLDNQLNLSDTRGTNLYNEVAEQKQSESPLVLGSCITLKRPEDTSFRGLLRYFRDSLAITPEALKQGTDMPLAPREVEDFYPNLRAFIRGFGVAALQRRNVVVGVIALDMAFEGGILGSEQARELVIRLTSSGEERLTAAEVIYSLSQERTRTAVSQSQPLGELCG